MKIELFASFPNIYPYKNIVYNTCDMFFTVYAPDLTEEDLHPEAGEVKMEDLAFDSTRKAIAAFLLNVLSYSQGEG
jgi:hypothetical protein